ncbi:MAG: cytochrome c biogenesis protein CcsA [Thermaerobacter sp.]|nr:cytochrome c biogenesis protein CcsA [Thermaerobacter sp.]
MARWWWVLLPGMIGVLYLDLLGSPDDALLGSSQRIFYVHMGAATVVAVAFTVTAAASVGYLVTGRLAWDRWAAASAEVGTLFTTMVLITGILWGRVAWGVWWTWDPRLTSTLILWVLFMGYLVMRDSAVTVERRARMSAVLALLCYLDVPLDYLTIRWWKSIHPVVITEHGINMARSMIVAMVASMVAMLFLYGAWVKLRVRLLAVEQEIEEKKAEVRIKLNSERWGD